MTGLFHLPQNFADLGKHLNYHWTLSYIINQGTSLYYNKKVVQNFKPILWYIKGKYQGEIVSDLIKPLRDTYEKELHIWQQSLDGFKKLVEMFTYPNQTVLDPFMGAGTTALACLQSNRRFIGCDIDPNCIDITRNRLLDELNPN
jgi:DNA modification methylase